VSEESRAAQILGLGLGPSWSIFGSAFVGAGARPSGVTTAYRERCEPGRFEGRDTAKPCPTAASPCCAADTSGICGND